MTENTKTEQQKPTSLPPFACYHTPDLPELLKREDITVLISTYQGGKVCCISAQNEDSVIQLPRNFNRTMGMAFDGQRLAIALQDEVIILANSPGLAKKYPNKLGTYDALFLPRQVHFTGSVAMHDLAWDKNGDLIGVATNFSCLCKFSDRNSFEPIWKPEFIDALTPDDRCHLNGLAMKDGEPAYVTAVGETNETKGWSEGRATGGILIDVKTDEIICRGLSMPHSPRCHNGKIYFCESGIGAISVFDPETKTKEIIGKVPAFTRGMSIHGDYLYFGKSKLRSRGSIGGKEKLPIQETGQTLEAGFGVIHLPTGGMMGQFTYATSCEEIYEILVLPGIKRPNLLNHNTPDHQTALSLPGQSYWAVNPEALAAKANEEQTGSEEKTKTD
ncbi:MAG: TIGR03032 family protein [SAR324 cluster bacterium]|nr:TIGR03032 family protein [SAR324 cluster bacterium]